MNEETEQQPEKTKEEMEIFLEKWLNMAALITEGYTKMGRKETKLVPLRETALLLKKEKQRKKHG